MRTRIWLMALLVCALVSTAHATLWQRDIRWTFDVSPQGGPSSSGAPGAQYEGTLDPLLWDSDYVTFSGALEWYDSLPGFTATGLIGIDNRLGATPVSGSAIFHIDNLPEPRPSKEFWGDWFRATNGVGPEVSLVSDGDEVPFGGGGAIPDPPPEFYGLFTAWHIYPNPPWEELVFDFSVPAGQYGLLNSVSVQSNCLVPEPASVCLLGLAGGAIATVVKKRKKAA